MTSYLGTKIEPKTELVIENENIELTEEMKLAIEEEAEQEDPFDAPIPLFEMPELDQFKAKKMFSDALILDEAVKYWQRTGFPYRALSTAECMLELQKLAETDNASLVNTALGYQVADTFHRHRVHASARGMHSPYDAFQDEKKLRKALRLQLKHGGNTKLAVTGVISLVNGTQACSNFRPGFACYLYRKYCPEGGVVLDTSTGYGGRLLGAVASQVVSKYIGIDPNTETHLANIKMIEELHLRELLEFELHNLPAEDIAVEVPANSCDFSFTSPPYFSKEIYSPQETQSCNRYTTWESWVDGFLKPMLRLTHDALKPDAKAVINVAETIRMRGGEVCNLGEATQHAAFERGFMLEDVLRFPMSKRMSGSTTEETAVAFEPVYVFSKV